MNFSELLRKYRNAAQLSQVQLGKAADVSASLINDIENGVRIPGRKSIMKLADGLHLNAAEARSFMLAGLQLSTRDHILPELEGCDPAIINALGIKLLEEARIKPEDIQSVESSMSAGKEPSHALRPDLVIRLKDGRAIAVEFKIKVNR